MPDPVPVTLDGKHHRDILLQSSLPPHPLLNPMWLRSSVWWGWDWEGGDHSSDFFCPRKCPGSHIPVPWSQAAMNMPQSLGNQPLPPEPPSLRTPAEGRKKLRPHLSTAGQYARRCAMNWTPSPSAPSSLAPAYPPSDARLCLP